MNPFDISVICINIAKSELLFEKYRMDLNQEKYDIDVRNDDAIKHNQIWFDFMQRTFNILDRLYLHEKCLLIDTIIKDQPKKQSAAEIEKLNENTGQKQKKGKYI